MRVWRTLLAGPVIWLAHFAFVYTIPSLAAVGAAPTLILVAIHGLVTLACLGLAAVLAAAAWRRARSGGIEEVFEARLGALGAALAAIAIVWQATPAFIELGAKGAI